MKSFQFVKFAKVKEDVPAYHRRYDVFISKFSSMCQSTVEDNKLRYDIRMSGIKGLQSVILKTVHDDLVQNIWKINQMKKILSSLVFSIQSADPIEFDSNRPSDENFSPPSMLAEKVLRNLISIGSFHHIEELIQPLLAHFDQQLWVPNQLPLKIFKIVMLSMQPQYSHMVIDLLISHMNNKTSSLRIKKPIAVILSKIISIVSDEVIGCAIFKIINNLLTQLRDSLINSSTFTMGPSQVHLVEALVQIANHQQDFQKIEIISFIMNWILKLSREGQPDQLLRTVLLKSLLKICEQYKTESFTKAFPQPFLDKLLHVTTVVQGNEARITILNILACLIDRHNNREKLKSITVDFSELSKEPPSSCDISFASKNLKQLLTALKNIMIQYDVFEIDESFYTTAAVMIIEMGCDETIQEFLFFLFDLQEIACSNQIKILSLSHTLNLHRIVIALYALLCKSFGFLKNHCENLFEKRREMRSFLLPPLRKDDSPLLQLDISNEMLLDRESLIGFMQQEKSSKDKLQRDIKRNISFDFFDTNAVDIFFSQIQT